MDGNKAHNKWKVPNSATTSLMLLSARANKQIFSRILLFKNCGHKHYKVTQEFFKKKNVGDNS